MSWILTRFRGGPPQTLVERLGQINAGVNDFGARLSAYGLPCAAGPWGWGPTPFRHKDAPGGLLALTGAILALTGPGWSEVP